MIETCHSVLGHKMPF